jgi:hypothetical protein
MSIIVVLIPGGCAWNLAKHMLHGVPADIELAALDDNIPSQYKLLDYPKSTPIRSSTKVNQTLPSGMISCLYNFFLVFRQFVSVCHICGFD